MRNEDLTTHHDVQGSSDADTWKKIILLLTNSEEKEVS